MIFRERWRDIPDHEGYQISDYGKVRSRRGLLKPWKINTGYWMIGLGRDFRKTVHKLVMLTFVGPCPEGLEVCHENNQRDDPRLKNMRYDTRKGNFADKIRHGTDSRYGKSTSARLTVEDVREIRRLQAAGFNYPTIAKQFGIHRDHARNIVSGHRWGYLDG